MALLPLSVLIGLSIVSVLWLTIPSGLSAADAEPLAPLPWPARDALGRRLPMPGEVPPPRQDRWVGIFYFLWHDSPAGKSPHWDGPYDISRIVAADPGALTNPKSPYWGPIGMYHYWGEPLYGYYRSDDPWVLRRHAALLADAGVDTLIFDTTNAVTYTPTFLKLCEVFNQIRQEGGTTPQICFMVNTEAGKTARRIYEDLYKKGLYPELWFRWEGKPLMICDPAAADEELKSFFTLRRAHWPFEMVNTPFAWHWEATYPQPYGYTTDPSKPEMVNVSVAQNLRVEDGRVTNMSDGNARGRSFHKGHMDTSPGSVNLGLNFEEQWKRVYELDPPFVMITGWNEWIAGRWGTPDGPLVFVDQFDQQYSRDIEPGKCSHTDNYYYQMVAHIRRYKGVPPLPSASKARTIRLAGPMNQWDDVQPEFRSRAGEVLPRDHAGVAGLHYTNQTGRNDIVLSKVARDNRNVYLYVRTAQPLTACTDPNWMWLLINANGDDADGWEGFEFIVNRNIEKEGRTWLEKSTGGWQWEKVAPVSFVVRGCEMHLAIPLKHLDIAGRSAFSIDFKWWDNAQRPGDILDVYTSGDAAPPGRYRFRYATGP